MSRPYTVFNVILCIGLRNSTNSSHARSSKHLSAPKIIILHQDILKEVKIVKILVLGTLDV